eukprot:506567-Hanusia_phi.AAC.1
MLRVEDDRDGDHDDGDDDDGDDGNNDDDDDDAFPMCGRKKNLFTTAGLADPVMGRERSDWDLHSPSKLLEVCCPILLSFLLVLSMLSLLPRVPPEVLPPAVQSVSVPSVSPVYKRLTAAQDLQGEEAFRYKKAFVSLCELDVSASHHDHRRVASCLPPTLLLHGSDDLVVRRSLFS